MTGDLCLVCEQPVGCVEITSGRPDRPYCERCWYRQKSRELERKLDSEVGLLRAGIMEALDVSTDIGLHLQHGPTAVPERMRQILIRSLGRRWKVLACTKPRERP